MGLIVCATRGGEGSQLAQRAAIVRAKAQGDRLVFIYVVNVDGQVGFDVTLRPALHDELAWLGKTLLKLAEQRSQLAGVAAETLIVEGNARQQIKAQLRALSADTLFLGAPQGSTANHFGDDAIELFAEEIRAETGVRVEVIYPESH